MFLLTVWNTPRKYHTYHTCFVHCSSGQEAASAPTWTWELPRLLINALISNLSLSSLPPAPLMVQWCRWSCQCCCSDAQLTCALVSLWSPSAAHSPCRTLSLPALLAPPRGGARSWASATQTWTTSRRTQSSTWVHVQTHISSDFSKTCYKHRFL